MPGVTGVTGVTGMLLELAGTDEEMIGLVEAEELLDVITLDLLLLFSDEDVLLELVFEELSELLFEELFELLLDDPARLLLGRLWTELASPGDGEALEGFTYGSA